MVLRILAVLLFAIGLVLLLYGWFAMDQMPEFGLYISFFGSLLWGIASIFIIVSRNSIERFHIRSPKG